MNIKRFCDQILNPAISRLTMLRAKMALRLDSAEFQYLNVVDVIKHANNISSIKSSLDKAEGTPLERYKKLHLKVVALTMMLQGIETHAPAISEIKQSLGDSNALIRFLKNLKNIWHLDVDEVIIQQATEQMKLYVDRYKTLYANAENFTDIEGFKKELDNFLVDLQSKFLSFFIGNLTTLQKRHIDTVAELNRRASALDESQRLSSKEHLLSDVQTSLIRVQEYILINQRPLPLAEFKQRLEIFNRALKQLKRAENAYIKSFLIKANEQCKGRYREYEQMHSIYNRYYDLTYEVDENFTRISESFRARKSLHGLERLKSTQALTREMDKEILKMQEALLSKCIDDLDESVAILNALCDNINPRLGSSYRLSNVIFEKLQRLKKYKKNYDGKTRFGMTQFNEMINDYQIAASSLAETSTHLLKDFHQSVTEEFESGRQFLILLGYDSFDSVVDKLSTMSYALKHSFRAEDGAMAGHHVKEMRLIHQELDDILRQLMDKKVSKAKEQLTQYKHQIESMLLQSTRLVRITDHSPFLTVLIKALTKEAEKNKTVILNQFPVSGETIMAELQALDSKKFDAFNAYSVVKSYLRMRGQLVFIRKHFGNRQRQGIAKLESLLADISQVLGWDAVELDSLMTSLNEVVEGLAVKKTRDIIAEDEVEPSLLVKQAENYQRHLRGRYTRLDADTKTLLGKITRVMGFSDEEVKLITALDDPIIQEVLDTYAAKLKGIRRELGHALQQLREVISQPVTTENAALIKQKLSFLIGYVEDNLLANLQKVWDAFQADCLEALKKESDKYFSQYNQLRANQQQFFDAIPDHGGPEEGQALNGELRIKRQAEAIEKARVDVSDISSEVLSNPIMCQYDTLKANERALMQYEMFLEEHGVVTDVVIKRRPSERSKSIFMQLIDGPNKRVQQKRIPAASLEENIERLSVVRKQKREAVTESLKKQYRVLLSVKDAFDRRFQPSNSEQSLLSSLEDYFPHRKYPGYHLAYQHITNFLTSFEKVSKEELDEAETSEDIAAIEAKFKGLLLRHQQELQILNKKFDGIYLNETTKITNQYLSLIDGKPAFIIAPLKRIEENARMRLMSAKAGESKLYHLRREFTRLMWLKYRFNDEGFIVACQLYNKVQQKLVELNQEAIKPDDPRVELLSNVSDRIERATLQYLASDTLDARYHYATRLKWQLNQLLIADYKALNLSGRAAVSTNIRELWQWVRVNIIAPLSDLIGLLYKRHAYTPYWGASPLETAVLEPASEFVDLAIPSEDVGVERGQFNAYLIAQEA